jgi:hypothetical protein
MKDEEIIDTLHPYVRKYVINGKISLEDAMEINKFDTEEFRKLLIEERLKILNWEGRSINLYEKQWKKHIEIRIKQESEIKTKMVVPIE